MKFKKLRGEIRSVFLTERACADYLGITEQSLSHKLNGKTDFRLSECISLMRGMDIPKSEMSRYFWVDGDDK